jgi:hypothetical protein
MADLRDLIIETANAIGANPLDLATAISFESGFRPDVWGGSGGRHFGLIQFGPAERAKYGVDTRNPVGSQLGKNGAIARYFRDRGFKPGMSGLDLYSTINAGSPGRYGASDTAAGGTPGDVRDKWVNQMGEHRQKAAALLNSLKQSDYPPGSIGGIGSPDQPGQNQPLFGSLSPSGTSSPGGGYGNSPPGLADWALADTSGKKSLGNRLAKAGEALQADMPAPPRTMQGGDARATGNMLLSTINDSSKIKDWLLQRRAPWLA